MPMASPSPSSTRPADLAAAADGVPTTLVVGLGNPLRGDDGVGWRVVDALREALRLDDARGDIGPVELEQLAVGGLTLMEHLVDHPRAILVDALTTGLVPPGTVTCRPLDRVETRTSAHLDSSHDAPLPAAIEAGRALGAELPAEIWTVGIEAVIRDEFADALSPDVAASVPAALEACLTLLSTS
jgi:hydrogenase maturation protease